MEMPTVSEVSQLSIAERIQFVEDVWDTIAAFPDQVPVPDAQRAELDRRLARYQQQPHDGASWEDVKKRVTGRA